MAKCNHTVGYLREFVTEKEIVEVITREAGEWNRSGTVMLRMGGSPKHYKNNYRPRDFLDGRKGYMTVFKFCPNCGEKIDWEAIKAKV